MDRTISKNQVLKLFLGLAIPVIVAGCSTISPEKTAQPTVTPQTDALINKPALVKPAERVVSVATPAVDGAPSAVDSVSSATDSSSGEPVVSLSSNETGSATANGDSIWVRIRSGFRMEAVDDALIAPHEQWFIDNAEFREAMLDRAKLYLYFIVEEVEKRNMPMEIALLPAIESAYKPYAYSRAKASGLWQFIPSTGKLYGLKINWWYDGRRDVIAATRAALDYLQKLHDDFDGDWQLALAAYNAGEGRVARAIEWNRRRGLPTKFEYLRQLRPETKQYVPKLLAMARLVANPDKYGLKLPDIPNEPYFVRVETDSQVDLGVIARLTGMEVDEVHRINAGYTRWATDPDGPHHLLVPVAKREVLVAGLSALPEKERVQWRHHEVRRGDTLHSIASHYRLTVEAIKTANNLRNNLLRVGQALLLPVSSSAISAGSPARAAAVRTAGSVPPVIHRVRSGETLYAIARRYNVLVKQIAEWNLIEPSDVLRMGQRLKIWPANRPSALYHDLDAAIYA